MTKRFLAILAFWLALSADLFAASPTVQAFAATSCTTCTAISVTLPSGSTDGDLVLIYMKDGTAGSTWSLTSGTTGWTELQDANGFAIYYKEIGAGEATPSFDCSGSDNLVAHAYRIDGHEDPATQAPETTTQATGTSTNPDPPSLTPTGGSADYLFIAAFGSAAPRTVSVYPTNYTNGQNTTVGSGGPAASIGSAERQLTAASDDPGTFTINNNVAWKASTVVIHPGGAAPADDLMVIGK
jgi:hypothetical protein